MSTLSDYVRAATDRGACRCGQCIDGDPAATDRAHTVSVEFFDVRVVGEPDAETLRGLIEDHVGEFGDAELFDGREHNYMEIGGWLGDQGTALLLMALGKALGLWRLTTPTNLFGAALSAEKRMELAGRGLVVIRGNDLTPRN